MSIFTSKKVWKFLIKIQLTKSDPKRTRVGKCPPSCQLLLTFSSIKLWLTWYTISALFFEKQTNCENSKFKIQDWKFVKPCDRNFSMAAPALPHIRRAAENGCSSMQAHSSSSRVSLWSYFPNFVQKLWGLILLSRSQSNPILIHKPTFKLLYFIIFTQNMIFIVILDHVSIILDRKKAA
jgi:hypothetical protein